MLDWRSPYLPLSMQSVGGAGTSSEDQEKLLTEALEQVKKTSFDMKTCLVRYGNQSNQ